MPWGSTPDSALPQGAYSPGQLASVLQDQSAAKFRTLAGGRFPGIVGGTSAGSPLSELSPLGFIVGLASHFFEEVATADPASITGPEDLLALIPGFFDLPLVEQFLDLKDAMFGDYIGDDPLLIFIQNLFAPIRKVLELASGVTSGIPTAGEIVAGWESIAANFSELLAAFKGTYTGSDPALLAIKSLATMWSGLIDPSRIPQLSLSQLTAQPGPNLLTGFGDFADGDTIDGGGVWTWDGAVANAAAGSARTTGDGTRHVLTSELVAVAQGQALECSGRVRWSGATGTGACMQLVVIPYIGGVAQPEIVVDDVVDPAASSGGVFVALSGDGWCPVDVTHFRVRITVEAALTAGTVWWDDVVLRKTATSLPQQWITGLTTALTDLWDGLGDLLDNALSALGVTPVGSILDRIMDLADELGNMLGVGEDNAAGLDNLISGLLANPASLLGMLPQSKITGLATALSDAATNLDTLADNINSAVADGVAAGSGAIADAFGSIAGLLGLARTARDIAITAQSQIQDLTNDNQVPPELNGMTWSTVFAGSDGAALPSGDWPSVSGLVIRGSSGHVGITSGNSNGWYWARTAQQFLTDSQSVSTVLGPRTNGDDAYAGLYLRCDSGFAAGAYCHVRKGNINFGRFTRSGTTVTWTQMSTVSGGVNEGDMVRFRVHAHTYYVVVNGITRASYTDGGASVATGASYRYAAISQQRTDSGFPFYVAIDAYRMAGFAMADWLPAGVSVTTASWRLRRGSGGEVALAVAHGAQAALPSGFYTVNDLAASVTVTDLGTGQVTIVEAGWYEIAATSQHRDNVADTSTPTGASDAHLANAWHASPWVLFVDGTAIAGPITAGVSATVYLAAGQVVRPGVAATSPIQPSAFRSGSTASAAVLEARSRITHVSGAPSASFTGRKVA